MSNVAQAKTNAEAVIGNVSPNSTEGKKQIKETINGDNGGIEEEAVFETNATTTLTTPIKKKAKLHNEVNKNTVVYNNVSLIPILKPTQMPISCVVKTPEHATIIPTQMVDDHVTANKNLSEELIIHSPN